MVRFVINGYFGIFKFATVSVLFYGCPAHLNLTAHHFAKHINNFVKIATTDCANGQRPILWKVFEKLFICANFAAKVSFDKIAIFKLVKVIENVALVHQD